MKSERDKVAAKARKLCADPVAKAEWSKAWDRVRDRLAPVYAAARPVLKSFEVRARHDVAREEMLRALVAGKSIAEAERLAFATCEGPLAPPPY